MKKMSKKEQCKVLFETLYKMDTLYSEYAKSAGFSYTTLLILNIIYEEINECTQKTIAQKTFLPKQTVNTVINSFYKEGLVVLKEKSDDRRNKTIHLTKKGKDLADKIISKINDAAIKALDETREEESVKLIELMENYVEKIRKNLEI